MGTVSPYVGFSRLLGWAANSDVISTHTRTQVGTQSDPRQNLPSSHLIYPFLYDVIYHIARHLEDSGVAGKHHCKMDPELRFITTKPGKSTGTGTMGTVTVTPGAGA